MSEKELGKVTGNFQTVVEEAFEQGATKEELLKIIDYIKYEVENSED